MNSRLASAILLFSAAWLGMSLLDQPDAALAVAPTVVSETATGVTSESATLRAEVNPGGKVTKYHFEYGLGDCAVSACTSVPPLPEPTLPGGAATVPVAPVQIEGLTPQSTYHFRIVAKNADGEVKGPDETFTTYQSPPVFGACPNDSLRTDQNPMFKFLDYLGENLPDCRGYEQASPVDKNGLDVKGLPMWVKASPEGDAATFMASGGAGGNEGAQELPPSLSRRGADGWSTTGMLPPASLGQEAIVLGWTPDFSQVYSAAVKLLPSRAMAILSRSADGEITEIVPHTAALTTFPSFPGAASDGSVAAFEARSKLLPAAVGGAASNVYLWERTTGELHLGSALNDGASPPQGAFAGPYDWGEGNLTRGGSAFDYYTQEQHAISEDGGALYFTAAGKGKGELYLRLNPTEPQSPLDSEDKCTDPGLACTIEVSASQKTNGTGPNFTDAAGKRPAAFMGASADGSVAFLTSSEKLTNDAYTGPEPAPPAIARAPLDDGDPKELSFEPTVATGVALNATHMYWANAEAGTIERALLDGTGSPQVFV
ncbi:MAG TPA: fibronectin type III domain-containing protein, partial [Acidimicrobiia bacterium]|nr:fibronectin type III domain-containing protein [Acidimicrobiia bacterium]